MQKCGMVGLVDRYKNLERHAVDGLQGHYLSQNGLISVLHFTVIMMSSLRPQSLVLIKSTGENEKAGWLVFEIHPTWFTEHE